MTPLHQNTHRRVIAVIPARYASVRFPGKPLAMLGDRPVIRWVYDRVGEAVDDVYVATDDVRILHAVEDFGGRAVLTSADHMSGSSRVAEACRLIGGEVDVVVNVQGDEPFISPGDIRKLAACFDDTSVSIATLVFPFPSDGSYAELSDPARPKVEVDSSGDAVCFSRSVIPYVRDVPTSQWPSLGIHLIHVGVYAFRIPTLYELIQLPPSAAEKAERLEQLRWLSGGFKIRAVTASSPSQGIDTPGDLQKALCKLKIFS